MHLLGDLADAVRVYLLLVWILTPRNVAKPLINVLDKRSVTRPGLLTNGPYSTSARNRKAKTVSAESWDLVSTMPRRICMITSGQIQSQSRRELTSIEVVLAMGGVNLSRTGRRDVVSGKSGIVTKVVHASTTAGLKDIGEMVK